MAIEEKLVILIENRYGSVNRFCDAHDIPKATFRTIIKRGIYNSNIKTLMAICRALNLDLDALSEGELRPKRKSSTSSKIDLHDVIEDAKLKIQSADQLSIEGKEIDFESAKSFLTSMDVGYGLTKKYNTMDNKK